MPFVTAQQLFFNKAKSGMHSCPVVTWALDHSRWTPD